MSVERALVNPVPAVPCAFSLDHYRSILLRALGMGYRFLTHREWRREGPTSEPTILLRHDIDLSLEKALPVLKLEYSLGIRSTIFVRVHAQGYNIFSVCNYALLDQYMAWGVEVGLHYEPQVALITRENRFDLLRRAKTVLEAVIRKPVRGLVSHTPKLALQLGQFTPGELKALGFSYRGDEAGFVQDRFYVSDSNRHWRRGCVCQHIGVQRHLTVLTHPFWWQPITDEERFVNIQRLREGA